MTKTVQYQNELHKFLIWDTAGQERVSKVKYLWKKFGPELRLLFISAPESHKMIWFYKHVLEHFSALLLKVGALDMFLFFIVVMIKV